MNQLEFEKPILDLEAKLQELRQGGGAAGVNVEEEIQRANQKIERLLKQTYAKLTPAQKVAVARHPNRPHTLAYIQALLDDFVPLAGDRLFSEDQALVAGLGRFRGRAVAVLGQEKGHDTETRIRHNFGMAKPEGYRKAQRLIDLAERFTMPILTFVDTAGAYPGVQAEERGQAQAIAASIDACLKATAPLIATVIGEGGSGGAIAIAAADRVLMLEHAIYSVISPEGCASILWRNPAQAAEAAAALRLTAQDLKELGVIDRIVAEPLGGAHRDPKATIEAVGAAIEAALGEVKGLDGSALRSQRRMKFLEMGQLALAS